MEETHLKRVFFALWPGDSVRQKIFNVLKQSIYVNSSGQAHGVNNLHLTLHFLGKLTASQLDCVLQQATTVKAKKFELLLDEFGHFEAPKILWLGPKKTPRHLSDLHTKLANALSICQVPIESRTYRPHVTLMRKFKGFKESHISNMMYWKVDQFALLESLSTENGVIYRPLKLYALKG